MRPMGHIVDLYISEILNSSVSRHITKVGGGQDWSRRFQRYFSKRKYAPNGHSHSYELYEQHGVFFQCMYTVCFLQGMVRISQGTVRCFFRTIDGLIKIVAWFVNVCMLILNEVDVTHRPYRFFFHYHFLKLWLLFNKYNYARIYWSKICVYIEEWILRPI